jgi:hypothetical protein
MGRIPPVRDGHRGVDRSQRDPDDVYGDCNRCVPCAVRQTETPMNTETRLEALYPGRIARPAAVEEMPRGVYLVYVLAYDDTPIVVGHGKHNRARIIFDEKDRVTPAHIKAIFVRAYRLFGKGKFQRFFIACDDKSEAKDIEAKLHQHIGGNSRDLPQHIQDAVFSGVPPGSIPHMVLRMAFSSSFDGISDLNMWRRQGILDDETWRVVGGGLQLEDANVKRR